MSAVNLTVTTVERLFALPHGSVLRSAGGYLVEFVSDPMKPTRAQGIYVADRMYLHRVRFFDRDGVREREGVLFPMTLLYYPGLLADVWVEGWKANDEWEGFLAANPVPPTNPYEGTRPEPVPAVVQAKNLRDFDKESHA